MWIHILVQLLGISISYSWIHDAKIIGTELIKNKINLPVKYFYVQFVNVYDQK